LLDVFTVIGDPDPDLFLAVFSLDPVRPVAADPIIVPYRARVFFSLGVSLACLKKKTVVVVPENLTSGLVPLPLFFQLADTFIIFKFLICSYGKTPPLN
jgi:hypothetical protein